MVLRSSRLWNKLNKIQLLIFVSFFFIFGISLGLYLFKENRVRRVLFFPEQGTKRLVGEIRYLPEMDNLEDNINLLVEEIILGPSRENHEILVPKEVSVESLILRDSVLYLDFSEEIVLKEMDLKLGFEKSLMVMANTVMFNFPLVEKVFVFINGEIPKNRAFLNGIEYNASLLQ